jgi:hypothetical protein
MTLPAVFNVTNFPTVPALVPNSTGDASNNSSYLNKMVALLLSAGGPTAGMGGTLVFPNSAGPYYFDGGIYVGQDDSTPPVTVASSIIFRGGGEQKRSAPTLQQLDASQTFFTVINNDGSSTGDNQIGGVIFEDLIISFAYADDESTAGVGIYVDAGSNVRVQRVTFDEVPDAALWFQKSLHCSVIDCNVRVAKVSNGTGLRLGKKNGQDQAIETYVAGTTFFASHTNGYGIQMYGVEHLRMTNCRFEGWQFGIYMDVAAGAGNIQEVFFGNVTVITSEEAVYLAVTGGESGHVTYIARVWFAECEFVPGSFTGEYSGGGVIIGPTDNAGNIIDGIRFVSCHSCLWGGPGIDIQGGTNIEIIGGYYSCNGTYSGEPPSPGNNSGIKISGPAEGVRIGNAACNNSLFEFENSAFSFASPTQQYGIYVGGGCSSVRIIGCDLTSNTASGIWVDGSEGASYVIIDSCDVQYNISSVETTNGILVDGSSGAVTNIYIRNCNAFGYSSFNVAILVQGALSNVETVEITNCSGYNDQHRVLSSTLPTSGSTFYPYTFGYWGPVEFYAAPGGGTISAIDIDGTNSGLKSGSFLLMPGEFALMNWAISIEGSPTFVVIGK